LGVGILPAKDRYHDTVKRALIKEGWIITGEQVTLEFEDRYLYVDIEASKTDTGLIILVEVKELEEVPSPVEALANAVGKYFLYRLALEHSEEKTPLYLAITENAYQHILSEAIGYKAVGAMNISLLVFDSEREEITRWIP
jgi:hypothetical protein